MERGPKCIHLLAPPTAVTKEAGRNGMTIINKNDPTKSSRPIRTNHLSGSRRLKMIIAISPAATAANWRMKK